MNRGLLPSLMVHLIVLAFIVFGLPSFMSKDLNMEYAMVAEIVPISEISNIKTKISDAKDKAETQTKKAPQAVEVSKEEEKKPEPQKQEDLKTEEAEKIPEKKQPKKEEKKKEVKKEEKKKVENKREDKKKKKKKDDDFEAAILKSLDEEKKKNQNAELDKDFKELETALKGDTNKKFDPNAQVSISEIDAVKAQITRNWNTTAFSGAADAKNLRVTLIIELDMEANVLSVKVGEKGPESPYYQVFVESAIRAVKSASPLQSLSREKYGAWKEIEFKFDSSGMIY